MKNNIKCDKNILKDIQFLKKFSKLPFKVIEESPKRVITAIVLKERIFKQNSQNFSKHDLLSSLQVKKLSNVTNDSSFDFFSKLEEKPVYEFKQRCLTKSSIHRDECSMHPSSSIPSISLKKREKFNTSIFKTSLSLKKLEYEYFSKLKFSNGMSKSVSSFKMNFKSNRASFKK
jgi:hypothetical protein